MAHALRQSFKTQRFKYRLKERTIEQKTMEGNDLAPFAPKSQAVIFEGVLASPPEGLTKMRAALLLRNEKWDAYIKMWKANTLPLKMLADAVNRLGIGFEVYTFLEPQIADAIDRWLTRKGIPTAVIPYQDIKELREDLDINRSITRVYVADDEHYKTLGLRATVVTPETRWSL